MANSKGLWPKSMLCASDSDSHLDHLVRIPQAPSAFMLQKWKTVEQTNEWKRRLYS